MKHIAILCLFNILSAVTVWGQEEPEGLIQYLLPEFQDGRVVYKDGRTYNVRINYSLVTNRFVFIDTEDNEIIKEIGEIENVGVVSIGSRSFQITQSGEASEMVQSSNPMIFATYKGKLTERGKLTAYGGRSQTSSTTTWNSFHSSGMTYQLEGDRRWIVTGINKTYLVEREGKMKKVTSLKQFLKIHPKQHTAAIEEFANSNGIDFESVEQVVKLCNFAEALD